MSRIITTSVITLGLVFGLGCAGKVHLSENFGEARRSTNERMIADPLAGSQASPEGLSPRSAEHVLENYSKGQRAQQHPREKRNRGAAIQVINN